MIVNLALYKAVGPPAVISPAYAPADAGIVAPYLCIALYHLHCYNHKFTPYECISSTIQGIGAAGCGCRDRPRALGRALGADTGADAHSGWVE